MHPSAAELLDSATESCLEAAFRTGEYDAAEELVQLALVRARADGDRATEAGALQQLGQLMHFRALDGDPASADAEAEETLFVEALAIRRELIDMSGVAESLYGLGLVNQVLRRDWAAAMPLFREATALADEHSNALIRSECHRHLGFYYATEAFEPQRALRHLCISLELRREWGDPRWIPSATFAIGMATLAAGQQQEGIDHLRRAVQEARDAGLSARRVASIEDWLRRAEAGESPGRG